MNGLRRAQFDRESITLLFFSSAAVNRSMPGCLTCRQRKVKCDGRPTLCQRCEKLGVQCRWKGTSLPRSVTDGSTSSHTTDLTQAGHKRFRTSAACEFCRKRKLKCDAVQPACTNCLRRSIDCVYVSRSVFSRTATTSTVPSSNDQTTNTLPISLDETQGPDEEFDSEHDEESSRQTDLENGEDRQYIHSKRKEIDPSMRASRSHTIETRDDANRPKITPSGSELMLFVDSFLENVHPICCNNFLHTGVLYEEVDKAPELLKLAICGSAGKFLDDVTQKANSYLWMAEARDLTFRELGNISTLTVSVLQFQVMHDIHEANFTSAWNLIGISNRMALKLRLYQRLPVTQSEGDSAYFIRNEVHRRLMWSCYVNDLLFSNDTNLIEDDIMTSLPLPCNLWNFNQGIPCTTLQLWQFSERILDGPVQQATNPCAYMIKILVVRRKILRFIMRNQEFNGEASWLENSAFQRLCAELQIWRHNLPRNFAYEERHMYTFRLSRHLDMFLMIHAWYHQAACTLFSTWISGIPGAALPNPLLQYPQEFLQRCADQALIHARAITLLIQKLLKVEPDHIFRDPWFGFCVLDSTRIQIAQMLQNPSKFPRNEVAKFVKLNLIALENTKGKIKLAESIYQECCSLLMISGMEFCIDQAKITPRPQNLAGSHAPGAFELFDRYSFLQPSRPAHPRNWDVLFSSTNFDGSSATREPSPDLQDAMRQHSPASSNVPDISFLYDDTDNLYSDWPEDFQWQQRNIDHTIATALLDMNVRTTSTSIEVNQEMTIPDHALGDTSSSLSHPF